jgi:phosphatidylserine/phosphatidylglycerophosphate/cardiolipin synthase-like enzyme
MIEVRTLDDGGQTAVEIAREVAEFLGRAERSLELALYDVKLSPEPAALVVGALEEVQARGVAVRLVFNEEFARPVAIPPPPEARPEMVDELPVPTKGVPGVPDLMHHKFVVLDGREVWTGSTNWTDDSWTREENVIVRVTSPEIATRYATVFEQLWSKPDVSRSGKVDPEPVLVDGHSVRAWFCPKRGEKLAHRIADKLARAERRIRIASPVITSGPILGTLAEVAGDGKVDLAGVIDSTQIHEVFRQWAENLGSPWKAGALRFLLQNADFTGKRSTPWAPDRVHDYMHAKMTIADDTIFVGSFNLSHSGEMNAENVLEIEHPELADRLAGWIDGVRARYPALDVENVPMPSGKRRRRLRSRLPLRRRG